MMKMIQTLTLKIFNLENYGVISHNSFYDTVKTIEKIADAFETISNFLSSMLQK